MQPQPTQEVPLSVPRRQFDVEDYIDVLRRHRSWILAPTFAGLVLGVIVAYLWPDSYRASGLIRVVPPKVPVQLVPTNLTEAMTQKVAGIHQTIVSRPILTNVIQTYNLYPDERKRRPMEDVIEHMRADISVGELRGLGRGMSSGSAFSVAFSYSDKRLATQVCSDVITRFVDESTRSRSQQTMTTTQFFREQLDAAKTELEDLDRRMSMFRSRNVGQLPEQEQGLFNRLTALESSVQSINSSMSRVNQEKLQLETNIRMLRDQAMMRASQGGSGQSGPGGTRQATSAEARLAEINREIARLESSISVMKESYTETHPDVRRLTGFLEMKKREQAQASAEAQAAVLEANAAQSGRAGGGSAAPAGQRIDFESASAIARVQSALQAKDMELEDMARRLRDTQVKIREANAQIQASPVAQQEYIQLVRQRTMAQDRFNDLSGKTQMSAMATEVESRQQGETLEILEQPVMPTEPFSPKREIIVIAGLIVGIGIGVGMASAREIKDSSLKNLKDVRAYTKLTVLGSIPLLENDFVVRRRRRLGWLAWAAALLLGVLLMTGSVVYYYTSRA
jgi:polysaccharide chain length determinant protein (PEP-CTERM system associated)